MEIRDVNTALTLFEEAAIKHAQATEEGDYKNANKSYEKIMSAISFLKENNAIEKLFDFFDHPSDGVKGWAATYLLPIKEKDALKVLGKIAKGNSIRALAAETTISEWKNGSLQL